MTRKAEHVLGADRQLAEYSPLGRAGPRLRDAVAGRSQTQGGRQQPLDVSGWREHEQALSLGADERLSRAMTSLNVS